MQEQKFNNALVWANEKEKKRGLGSGSNDRNIYTFWFLLAGIIGIIFVIWIIFVFLSVSGKETKDLDKGLSGIGIGSSAQIEDISALESMRKPALHDSTAYMSEFVY